MDGQSELKEGLYFIHGYYMQENDNANKLFRDQMILMKDSIEDVYNIQAFDINTVEMWMETRIPQGEFAYFDGKGLLTAEHNPTAIMYSELNRQLSNSISYLNYGNQPEELSEDVTDVRSYHINVGHGNCSIIVFCQNGNWNIWMVDCSVFDFTNKHNYCKNLDDCMDDIKNDYGIDIISKLLITHLHYDHINGIEHLIEREWINEDTEVWMNIQYPWKQPTYNRILLQLNSLGVKFIDPIVSNSTQHINILYPTISFNKKNKSPEDSINNASVLYQICLGNEKMLFTGDIETEGWDNVSTCRTYLKKSTYYCISHHGSITGHLRSNCGLNWRHISTLADCADLTEFQILMGRNGAYRGVYSDQVLSDFNNIVKTEDATRYIKIEWSNGKIDCK